MDVHIFPSTKHAQIDDFCREDIPAFRGIQHRFAGYSLDFCYHNCEVPLDFMHALDAQLLESCVEMRLQQQDFLPVENAGVAGMCRITESNYALFSAVHDKYSASMFWTSTRIAARLKNWYIAMLNISEGYVLMNIAGDEAEVYALVAPRDHDRVNLLNAAAHHAFACAKREILFMVDETFIHQAEEARSIGFRACGTYVAYRVEQV